MKTHNDDITIYCVLILRGSEFQPVCM